MPTIEIVSIAAVEIPAIGKYEGFAYIANSNVISHRGIFQDILSECGGIIVHLGNKEFEGDEDGPWFAGALMEWDEETTDTPAVFEPHRFPDVLNLLNILVEASPTHETIFLTDYQCGLDNRHIAKDFISVSEFSELHNNRELRYNALYKIRGSSENS